MRAKEFISEEDVSGLKTKIINQVKKTDDKDLLVRLYTTLNKTGLADRIAPVLSRDTDTKGYIQELVDLILDVPGTYEDKQAFIVGYPNGYVDINEMLSGKYVKFENLITGGEGTPIKFVREVFNALKQTTFGGAKGPGEFALAVLSPKIKITGKGDLNIGDKVIEVKANAKGSGGRLGTPGMLAVDNIRQILTPYMTEYMVPKGAGLNLNKLPELLNKNKLNPGQKKELCSTLFNYIFKGEVDISELVNSIVSGKDPTPYYVKANYEIYRKKSGFTGMLLVNFPAQACKYYEDPLQMAEEINAINVYILSANEGFEARQILSQVTLQRTKEPKDTLKTIKVEKDKISPAPKTATPAPTAATPAPKTATPAPTAPQSTLAPTAPQSTLAPRTDSTWRQKYRQR
jgi:hypothetical protein